MNHPSCSFKAIITSLLETDLYKFTMWQVLLHAAPGARAKYKFLCRNSTAFPLAELANEMNEQLDYLCELQFTCDELEYLGSLRYLKSDFIDFLRIFKLQRKFISVTVEEGALCISAEGPQIHVLPFEIYVLAILNELYFKRFPQELALMEGRKRLHDKLAVLSADVAKIPMQFPFEFSELGLRRRFSGAWQDEVVRTLLKDAAPWFKGTSNVFLAKKYGVTPIGTMGHEFLQSYQAFGVRLQDFQKAALDAWVHEYRGDLGIALTDVIGMDAFLRDFDLYFAKLFDGLRHDSGDPYVWGEKAIEHYVSLRISPASKRLVFTNGLTFPEALALYHHFGNRTMVSPGIGTYLTNDMGVPPLNIVMKLIECNGQSVAKISDSPGKTMCENKKYLDYLTSVFSKDSGLEGAQC
jgi:nicotinate phosphoribosyltransferase